MEVVERRLKETYANVEQASGEAKIIFVNRFYWPDHSATSQLLTELAEHTAATGRCVLVIASKLFYADRNLVMERREVQRNVEIHRVRTTQFNRHSLIGQLLNFLTFYLSAALTLLCETNRHDVIVVKSDPPLFHLLAWCVAKLRRAKVINWCQDLFPEIAIGCGIGWANGPVGGTVRAIRNSVLSRSDANVVITPAMKTALQIQGVPQKRIEVVRNWSVGEVEPVSAPDNPLRYSWKLEDQFVIGYSGNLGRAHLIGQIHFLIEQFADVPNLKFLFIGAGYGMEQLRSICQKKRYGHVIFKPYQPKTRLSLSLSIPDLHLVSLNARCQDWMSPSKYYGVLAAGRPVALIGSRRSDLAREIEEFDLGLVLDLYEPSAWRSRIEAVRNDRDHLIKLGQSARQFYERRLTPAHSLSAWTSIIASHEVGVRAYEPVGTTS